MCPFSFWESELDQDNAPLEFIENMVVLELCVAVALKLDSAPCPVMLISAEDVKP